MKKVNYIFYLFFFISGATALIYEVIWARILQLTFGSTVYAITTVLTAFMAGLSIGSYYMGKFAETKRYPLFIYGLLELGIGIYALLAPFFLELTDSLYLMYYHKIWQQHQILFIARFFHSFIVLLLPTIFMGATLPVLSKYFISTYEKFGRVISLLYAVNTFGAMIGTAFVGFYALPEMGMILTNRIAGSANIAIGIISLIFFWIQKKRMTESFKPESIEVSSESVIKEDNIVVSDEIPPARVIKYIKILLLVSGYAAMAYEILWTRTLELFINSTTYSFSIILVTYLSGIASGSLINGVVLKNRFNKVIHLSIIQLIIGIFVFISFPIFVYIPRLVLVVWQMAPGSYFINTLAKVFFSLIIMLIPTVCMGMTFPIATEIYSKYRKRISQDIGTAYAYTTWGNILGSFITGVFMISLFGIQNNLKICIILNIILALTGFILFYTQSIKISYVLGSLALFVIMLVPIYPAWNSYILDSGVFIYQQRYSQAPLFNELASDWPILYYKEGINALITIRNSGDAIMMRTNGKTDASTYTLDMRSQLLAAYIPMALKPDAKKLLVIGLGSGITAGTIAQIPELEYMDCIEIEKAVLESAKYFELYNKKILNNRKVNIYIEDGKSFLKSTRQHYDIISIHLSNPWIAGIANLFTVDAYELMKAKLNGDGIVLQWFHTYRVSPDLLRMVIRTFAKVFPYYQMWSEGPSIFLIGSKKPIPQFSDKFVNFANNSDIVKKDLRTYFGIEDARAFIAFFISENEKLREFVGQGELNTDDKPLLEFELPKYFYFDYLENWNWQIMLQFRNTEDWLNKYFHMANDDYIYYVLAVAKNHQGFTQEAYELIERGLQLKPDSANLLGLKAYIVGMQNPPAASELFNKAINLDPNNAENYYRYAIFLLNRYSADASLPHFKRAEELGYNYKEFWLNYASALTKSNDFSSAIEVLNKGLPYADDFAFKFYEQIGLNYSALKKPQNALDAFKFYEQIGLNYSALKKPQNALDAYKKASELNQYYSIIYSRAADIYLQIGLYTVAENFYNMAISTEPSQYVYYVKLAEVLARLGRYEQAKDMLYKAYLLTSNKLEIYNAAAFLGLRFP